MRLLIVVPEQDRATGNWITAARLREGLAARGHAVTLAEAAADPRQLAGAVAAAAPELVLLLHAWRSGRPWLATGIPLPFAVLLTGTDVNIGLRDPIQQPTIAAVLQGAAAILSQNPLTAEQLCRECPRLAARIHYLPPGITLGDAPFPLQPQLAALPEGMLCLAPAGIRPVKGVLELIALCAPLADEGRPVRLVFCGPLLDDDYGRRFLAAVAARPWAAYLGIVPPAAMPAVMLQADLVVSNSFSEGLPNALVEATALGRPIVARAIPGNAAVVADLVNGLLFHDGDSFLAAIRRLRDEPQLRTALSRPDPERFSAAREAAVLECVCRTILAAPQTRQL